MEGLSIFDRNGVKELLFMMVELENSNTGSLEELQKLQLIVKILKDQYHLSNSRISQLFDAKGISYDFQGRDYDNY